MITLIRNLFLTDRTIGKLYIDGAFFCYTLEDIVREHGVKVYGETAIDQGVYYVSVTDSPTFKRALPLVYDVDRFTGIRFHRGNRPQDTEGCILVGYKFDKNTTNVYESTPCEAELVKRLGESKQILVVTRDLKGIV